MGRGRERRLSRGLVTAQVALDVVLVTGAGLLLRSFHQLVTTDPGFRYQDVTAASVSPPFARYTSSEDRRVFFDDLLARIRALPGVTEVSAIHLLPLTPGNWGFPYLAEGHVPRGDQPLPSANFRIVTPGYFEMMGIGLLRGRTFARSDLPGDARVGVVNERMARLLWPDEEAVGKVIQLFGNQPFTVVGVVADVRQFALDRESVAEMYVPYAQYPWAGLHLLIRSAAGPAGLAPLVRAAVREIDAEVPVATVQSYTEVLGESVAEPRFYAVLMGAFGVLALGLGALGVYGVTSYVVGARLPEFGVRLVLGAAAGTVVRGALVDALVPVVVGVAVGLAGAAAAGRLLASLLYGVAPTDPWTFAAVAAVLTGIGAAAAWLPARRAGRVDPVEVLNAG